MKDVTKFLFFLVRHVLLESMEGALTLLRVFAVLRSVTYDRVFACILDMPRPTVVWGASDFTAFSTE